MKQLLKPLIFAVTTTTGIMLSGCNAGLDPNTFTVELDVIDTSNWYAQNQSATVLTIRSNIAEPIDVSHVSVNHGQCRYEGYRRSLEYPQHFKMGQRLRLKLTDCSYSNVVQVDVETDKGTASYSFQ